MVKGPSGLPPVDRLLQFLVDSSGDGTEVVRCANCDLECGKQAGAPGVQWGAEGTRLHCPDAISSEDHPTVGSPAPPSGTSYPEQGPHFTGVGTEVQNNSLEPTVC